ncbi:MAG: site-specific integrase [Acidobacteriota bacterium]|nr:site-specific integrase [Acidobacteriota bacterium]
MPAGSLALYRLHARGCPHRPKGRRWTRCNCAIWVQGSLGGNWVKKSLSTRDWTVAAATIHEWEAAREIGGKPFVVPTISEALQKYFDDAEARHLAPSTIRKRRELLTGKLLPYCKSKGHEQLKDLNIDTLRSFRKSWKYAATSAVKRLEYLRGFLRFCEESEWIERNPAKAIKPPRVTQKPTLPFEDAEVTRILAAADQLADWGSFGRKLRAMVMLLRHSGLRIQDAACLERSRLKDDKLFLYTQKTGTPVNCPLPPETVKALEGLENDRAEYFFWDGKSDRETTVKSWNRVFQKVFAAAEPPVVGGHAHRFRDTFAISLLLKGVDLANVSVLLGHSSIKVTERHYSPWVKARQDQLEADVRLTWAPTSAGDHKGSGVSGEKPRRRKIRFRAPSVH